MEPKEVKAGAEEICCCTGQLAIAKETREVVDLKKKTIWLSVLEPPTHGHSAPLPLGLWWSPWGSRQTEKEERPESQHLLHGHIHWDLSSTSPHLNVSPPLHGAIGQCSIFHTWAFGELARSKYTYSPVPGAALITPAKGWRQHVPLTRGVDRSNNSDACFNKKEEEPFWWGAQFPSDGLVLQLSATDS